MEDRLALAFDFCVDLTGIFLRSPSNIRKKPAPLKLSKTTNNE
jgi:hypothetical protein